MSRLEQVVAVPYLELGRRWTVESPRGVMTRAPRVTATGALEVDAVHLTDHREEALRVTPQRGDEPPGLQLWFAIIPSALRVKRVAHPPTPRAEDPRWAAAAACPVATVARFLCGSRRMVRTMRRRVLFTPEPCTEARGVRAVRERDENGRATQGP